MLAGAARPAGVALDSPVIDWADVLRARGATALSVSDAEAEEAIRWAWSEHGLMVEHGGAVALAAVQCGKVAPCEDLVLVLSGGNIDPALHARVVAAG